ncbi:hypothetical protein N431DRAFT_555545 [Stipitochalara longipes BDJ]|nr:hypothetical protein N431DRAFT_555545 [Stipitochalara longipes BDJ]
MFFRTTQVFAALMLISSALALALPNAKPEAQPVEVLVEGESFIEFAQIQCENERHGLKPICPHLNKTADNGCIRYVKGFDITGVVTEVDLTFPEINDACDCIQSCLNRPTTCAAWVYKFSTADAVMSGHRTCTLYSQFNLPSEVVIEIDVTNPNNSNINAQELVANGNNPQNGATVAQTFMDVNLNATVDKDAVSGAVWQLSTGKAIC